MNGKNITLLIVGSLLLLFIFHMTVDRGQKPFNCTIEFKQKSGLPSDPDRLIKTDASLTVFLTGKESGLFTMIGTVETDKEVYKLNRRVNFVVAPKEIHGFTLVTVTSVKPYSMDNTPEGLWSSSVFPESQLVEFYVRIKKINKNTLLINSLSLPYLICVIQEG